MLRVESHPHYVQLFRLHGYEWSIISVYQLMDFS